MRDYALGTTFDVHFSTRSPYTGAPITLAGTPAVAAYPDSSLTQITTGVSLSVDFDGLTGLNNIHVVGTTNNSFASGSNYALVITAGTVDSVSVIGEVVAEFSLEAQSHLRPSVVGRTLNAASDGSVTMGAIVSGVDLTSTMKSSVNAEVVDAVNVDSYGEPSQGAPGVTGSLVYKTGYLYKAWRNKSTQDATDYKLYADDASTVDHKATVSDDATTFTRGEVGSGP